MRLVLVVLLIAVILILNFVLFYFLGIPDLIRELAKNKDKKKRKTPAKPEWIEMQTDVQQRAKERRRKEEVERRKQNAARKRNGFYAELEKAYQKA
jgi:predicted Holliday junction resolvase-like endonuclease